ncbi:hypothetical protein ERJ75_001409600 [Trypanosoma vivax]|nr:hypothetical protein ERJ75_001409600 [Trypanosoma vivax]
MLTGGAAVTEGSLPSKVRDNVISVGDLVAYDTLKDDSWCYDMGHVTFLSDHIARISVSNCPPATEKEMQIAACKRKLIKLCEELQRGRNAVEEERLATLKTQVENARNMVKGIEGACFREVQTYTTPPPLVQQILDDVIEILGIRANSSSWHHLQLQIKQPGFLSRVLNFDSSKLSAERRSEIIKRCRSKDISDDNALKASRAAGLLHQWVKAQLNYIDTDRVSVAVTNSPTHEQLERVVLEIKETQGCLADLEKSSLGVTRSQEEKTILRSSIITASVSDRKISMMSTVHRPELVNYITTFLEKDNANSMHNTSPTTPAETPKYHNVSECEEPENEKKCVDQVEQHIIVPNVTDDIQNENICLLQKLYQSNDENKALRLQLKNAVDSERQGKDNNNDLAHSLSELKKENERLQNMLQEAKKISEEAMKNLDETRKENHILREVVEMKKDGQVSDLLQQLDALQRSNNEMKQKLVTENKRSESLSEKILCAQKEIKALQEKIDENTKISKSHTRENSETKQKEESEEQKDKTEYTKRQIQNKRKEETRDEKYMQWTQNEDNLQRQKKQTTEKQKNEKTPIREEKQISQKEIKAAGASAKELEKLRGDNARLEAELKAAGASAKELEKLRGDNARLEAELKAAGASAKELEKLRGDNARLEAELKAAGASAKELEKLRGDNARLEAELKAGGASAKELEKLRGDNARLEAELKAAGASAKELEKLRGDNARLEAELKAAGASAKELEKLRATMPTGGGGGGGGGGGDWTGAELKAGGASAKELEKLRGDNARLEAELKAAGASAKELEKLRGDNARLEAELKAAGASAKELEKLRGDNARLEAELKAAGRARRSWRSCAATMRDWRRS